MADEPETFDEWCVVELLGHRRLAAHVVEVQLAGHGFLRLDIPDGQTQLINPSSVYALHPVSEAVCRAVATHCRPDPVQRWELPASEPTPAEVADVAAWAGGEDDDLDDEDDD